MDTLLVQNTPLETVQVAGAYDVVVIGGGVAGVAAALAARRNGKSVVILEKGTMLGGLATMGLVTWYLALCDGHGHKIIRGIAEELLRRSIRYGYNTLPKIWADGPDYVEDADERYVTRFSPAEFAASLEELMQQEGVHFVYDTLFTEPLMEGVRCKGVLVDECGGPRAYLGRVFIDASGDCDLASRAGAATVWSDTNVSYWTYNTSLQCMAHAAETGRILDALDVHWYGDEPRVKHPLYPPMVVKDAASVTQFVLQGRQCFADNLRAKGKGEDHATVCIGAMPQLRTTRRIDGVRTLRPEDIDRHCSDSIGAVGDWRKPGPRYEVPYGALCAPQLENIFAAGRCISSDGDAWEVTRSIPASALTGQAAGTAAALLLELDTSAQTLPIEALQQRLTDAGVLIHFL